MKRRHSYIASTTAGAGVGWDVGVAAPAVGAGGGREGLAVPRAESGIGRSLVFKRDSLTRFLRPEYNFIRLQKRFFQNSCPTWNPFDVRVNRNRSKDDNHEKPVPRKICRAPFSVCAHSVEQPAWASRKSHRTGTFKRKETKRNQKKPNTWPAPPPWFLSLLLYDWPSPSLLRQSCRRWSWWAAPWGCHSPPRPPSARYTHPLHAHSHLTHANINHSSPLGLNST